MRLTGFELKKIVSSPVVWVMSVLLILFNVFLLLFGSQPGYSAVDSPFRTNIAEQQKNGDEFAGEICDEWYYGIKEKQKEYTENPENRVSEAEQEKIYSDLLAEGYTEADIEEMSSYIYLKSEAMHSNDYQKYEPIGFAALFYSNAEAYGKEAAEEYRKLYPGKKGETLAAKTEEMYKTLSETPAYYNYYLGWQKLRNIHQTYVFTLGLLVLIALSSIFSEEYARKTEALILSSRYGRKKVIFAKIKAGLIFSVSAWAVTEALNAAIIFSLYGSTGAESYWQNFRLDCAPFLFNQGQITLVTVLTSLLGVIFLASAVMLFSAAFRSRVASLISGGILLLAPFFCGSPTEKTLIQQIFDFTPARLIMSIGEWQKFGLFYIFGFAVPVQYVIIFAAVIISAAAAFASFLIFSRRQVKN